MTGNDFEYQSTNSHFDYFDLFFLKLLKNRLVLISRDKSFLVSLPKFVKDVCLFLGLFCVILLSCFCFT